MKYLVRALGAMSLVALFAYDALGRRITSARLYNADSIGMDQHLHYYYDGQNSLAEYDQSDNHSRRHIHGTNRIDLRVLHHPSGHVLLMATLDNLGKGASGAAVQNLNLMLGLDEDRGLERE